MPPKHPVKERAWGSRYDTLKSAPSSPTSKSHPTETPATPHGPMAAGNKAGDAPVPELGSSTPPSTKSERPTNDNSIFVGSLPTHFEPQELGCMLSQHFSEYPQVKDIKAIRDLNKGSMCAFLTCEDATAAAQLLTTLKEAPPHPFQGRLLRFEFARASRTLVITYRSPAQLVHSTSGPDIALSANITNVNFASGLPTAMRIYRPHDSKHPTTVLYDSEAINSEAQIAAKSDSTVVDDTLTGAGVLINPLKYDSETLKKIVLAFGPLEHFGPYVANRDDSSRSPKPFSDIPRTPGMENGTWEVKWANRDDCVNASTTLRRVPYLQVKWAHHLNNDGTPFGSPSGSPGPLHRAMLSRMRTLSRPSIHEGEYQRYQDSSSQFSPSFVPTSGSLRLTTSPFHETPHTPSFGQWSPSRGSPGVRGASSPLVKRVVGDVFSPDKTLTPKLNEEEFPPLHGSDRGRKAARPLALTWTPKGRQDKSRSLDRDAEPPTSPSSSSSLSVQPSTPGVLRLTPSPRGEAERRAVSQPPSRSFTADIDEMDHGQDVTVPPTPDFTTASFTPVTPKTGSSYPMTPRSAATTFSATEVPESYHMTPKRGNRFRSGHGHREESESGHEVDPCSLFVGNLEVGATHGWTEDRLRFVFGKYGTLEDVKLYEPAHKHVAFAFVRYMHPGSCARAIASEHQRVYDGRTIRVQLREIKHPGQRAQFRALRGRGRPRVSEGSPRRLSSVIDFNGPPRDEFSVTFSPKETHDHPPHLQDPRHLVVHDTQGPREPRRHAMDSAPSGHFSVGPPPEHVEHKGPSPPDMHGTPWTLQMYNGGHNPERSVTAPSSTTSASVSPPPSSHGSHPPPAPGQMGPYPMMMPWMQPYHHYPWGMQYVPPYMGYPPQSVPGYPPAGQDGANAEQNMAQHQAWAAQAQMYKPMDYAPGTGPSEQNLSQMYPGQADGVQPPLQAVAFEHTSSGMFVPMYPPDALSQYMSSQGLQVYGQTPGPQNPAGQQQQSGYPPYPIPQIQMQGYSYSYPSQMSITPSTSQGSMSASTSQHAGLPSINTWSHGLPQATNAPAQTQLQGTPPPFLLTPSTSSVGPVSISNSVSWGGHYMGTGQRIADQPYGYRTAAPPRRGAHKAHGQNNRYLGVQASPGRFYKQGLDASYSFTDGIPQSRSHQPGAMRPSGSYSAPFAGSQSMNAMG
ncbi:hypothetical protein BDW22DRAFT_15242 [Trametopsis cervina]|nr:hypothetical protein BDW22DRAFT_15242 [Trametopsis cervina]